MTNKAIQKVVAIAGSQQKLASLCGVKQPTVWRWLHGGGNPWFPEVLEGERLNDQRRLDPATYA